ncbi:MAG: hypothetical protein MUO58_12510 [Anaerolineales bacterium]|nr:hypothetical protein [Anaerolineales bacterium]
MSEEKRFTLSEAQLEFAKKINGSVRDSLDKPDRSRARIRKPSSDKISRQVTWILSQLLPAIPRHRDR